MNVVLYTKTNCNYCDAAKKLLRDRGQGFNELRLDEDFTREHLLSKYPDAKTYPVVVVDGFYIGGYQQLKEEVNSNSSQKLLME